MASHDRYAHPLCERYASNEMQKIFSPKKRFGTWRRLWLALAESEAELGIDISDAALEQMRAALDSLDLERAADYERRFRHDVMAHVHLFGDDAPAAKGIIHLGATSAFIGDNDPITQATVWEYHCNAEAIASHNCSKFFFTATMGGAERLPNGNTLITQAEAGRAFEVTPGGQIVWEYYGEKKVYRTYRVDTSWMNQGPFPKFIW